MFPCWMARWNGRKFPASLQDAMNCGMRYQTHRVWLISGCPSGTKRSTNSDAFGLGGNGKLVKHAAAHRAAFLPLAFLAGPARTANPGRMDLKTGGLSDESRMRCRGATRGN